MVQSPSCEANWFAASQEISPHFTEPEDSINRYTHIGAYIYICTVVTGHSMPLVSSDPCAMLSTVIDCELSIQDYWEIQAHIAIVNTEFICLL